MLDKEKYSFQNLIKFSGEKFKNSVDTGTVGVLNKGKISKSDRIAEYAKDCPYGDENDKMFMKQMIRRQLTECTLQGSDSFPPGYGITHENIDQVVDWTSPGVDPYLKFLAVLQHYKVTYQKNALGHIIETYGWNKLRKLNDEESGFYVDEEDVNQMWNFEGLDLTYEQKLDVITQVVYEESRGNSCIDEVIYQNVGDISVGVSGIPDTVFTGEAININPAYKGVWIRYKGASIHFRFLSFQTYENMKRVCKQGVGYQMKGQFSEKEGFKLGYGKDGSRRSAAIEPFGESPALWVRKFTAKNDTNESLFNNMPGYEKVIDVERAFVRGGITIPVCGAQGSGKTTKMEAFVQYVQPFYSIRVLESEFEARLRWKYPNKNIYSMESNEDSEVKPSDAYNFTLRTAGDIYVIGEARSDDMIVNVTRTANRGGRAVYFTFHPNSPEATIPEIANAMIREKMYVNLKDAVATALETVKVCVFVRMDLERGCRYYEVYEFVPRDNRIPNDFMDPSLPMEESQRKFMETMYSYMSNMTSADTYFDTIPIVVFNRKGGYYEFKNPVSDKLFKTLIDNTPLQYERDEVTGLFRPKQRFEEYVKEQNIDVASLDKEAVDQLIQTLHLNPAFFSYKDVFKERG